MIHVRKAEAAAEAAPIGGLVGVLLKPLLRGLRGEQRPQPRLELLERITLAPRQSLALVEAEGRRFLIATSVEGGPVFYALGGDARPSPHRAPRVSW